MRLEALAAGYKSIRNFKVEEFLDKKADKLVKFFRDANLNAAVVGMSGGIDSSLTLYLLDYVKNLPNSPLENIEAITVPIYGTEGVTGQVAATAHANIVMESLGYPANEVVLANAYNSVIGASRSMHHKVDLLDVIWAEGQMASVLRTSVFYYHAAMLQAEGYKSLVVGTTNLSEGGYIGFFGKASDAAVDLQPIADMYKSEVYKLSKHLGVPQVILDLQPRGDVWDDKTDEDMIGAPYWFLELYMQMKQSGEINLYPKYLVDYLADMELFETYAKAIELLHEKNAHKYQVGNPAQFVDVMNRFVPGGWQPILK